MAAPLLLLLAAALGDEDWEKAAFARMLAETLLFVRAVAVLVVPEGAPALPAEAALTCRLQALRFGLVADHLVALARTHGIRRALAIGPVAQTILDALAANGVGCRSLGPEDARGDPLAPAPMPIAPCGLSRDEARARIDAPTRRPIELAFPSAGTSVALEAVDRVASGRAGRRPLLVLADEWPDAAFIRQHVLIRRAEEHVLLCGTVPAADRATLITAANLLHTGETAGLYQGEAARIAAANGTPITGAGSSGHGSAADWAAWALADEGRGRARPRPAREDGVAVFLPTWRCRRWLPDAIAGILAQTHRPLHLFVCDDGGEDVDAPLCARFPDATFLATESCCGPYAIANLLSAATVSDCIAFQDADDLSGSERLSSQLADLHRLRLDAIGCNSRVIDLEGALLGVETRPLAVSSAVRSDGLDLLLHPTSLFRRSTLESLGGFDSTTRFGADTELHLRGALTHRFGNHPALLYTRRERPESLTRARDTGFGSLARMGYSDAVRAAFFRALAGDVAPSPGRTLLGAAIPAPDLGQLRLVQAGRGCAAWLAQRAAQIRA